eukprot:TRINITY_DN7393_c0_g1_i1.p1 TRINITY_DN7393_c0_g1~~TRINITY_DN7393_c0_g1_i1.p1  ORF type:complete len:747 (-),score=208.47 TRINITY_DN7393_c0_g1_i1:88-2328(-)
MTSTADTKRRRLSAGWNLRNEEGETPSKFLEPNDDEAEIALQKTPFKPPLVDEEEEEDATAPSTVKKDDKRRKTPMPPNNARAAASHHHLSNDELANMYSNVIRMSTENKITAKNAWQLNLIDYMGDVLEQQQEEGGGANFIAASSTLDASVKIYSSRVDAVHSETYTVLTHLTRTEQRPEEGFDDDDEHRENAGGEENGGVAEEGENGNQKSKKSKRVLVGGVNTLETNLDNITAKKIDMEFMVDPLFRKTSAAFDEGGAKGLLLNHLSVYRGCELIFDSVDAVTKTNDNADEIPQGCDITDLQVDFTRLIEESKNLQICSTFRNFHFATTNAVTNDVPTTDGKAKVVDEGEARKMGNESMDNGDAPMFHLSDNEDEGRFPDIGPGGDDDDGDVNEPGVPNFDMMYNESSNHGEENDGVEAVRVTDDSWMEFGYFNPKVLQNWAGPDHWKHTNLSKSTTSKDAAKEDGDKKGKKKDAFFVDFLGAPPPKSLFEPGKGTTVLSNTVLKKATETSITLPPDVHYSLKNLTQLFNKPKWMVPPVGKRLRMSSNNGNLDWVPASQDGEFYVGGGGNNEQGGDNNPGDDSDNDVVGFDPSTLNNMNEEYDAQIPNDNSNDFNGDFVSQPARVPKVSINYVKIAKKIDVKALKATLWTRLCESPNNDETVTETPKPKEKGKEKEKEKDKNKDEKTMDGNRDFSTVLGGLKVNSGIGEASVAMCFICLLHLANEKTLTLKQTSMDDLTILPK